MCVDYNKMLFLGGMQDSCRWYKDENLLFLFVLTWDQPTFSITQTSLFISLL